MFFYIQGKGKVQIPIHATPGVVPSMYTGHPSYAYPRGRDYATDRGYPGARGFPDDRNESLGGTYPSGAPPLGMHQGNPAPTGFPNLNSMKC